MFGNFFHKMASPPWFYRISGKLVPWFGAACALVTLYGLYGGLVLAPADPATRARPRHRSPQPDRAASTR